MSENREKCVVQDGKHVIPCSALNDSCEGGVPVGKARGIYVWAFTNRQTRDPSRTLFGAKTSHNPKGIIFNFCPWCGTDISEAQP